ncbi:MAG TPA: hypothetical protein VFL83_18020 [Anaeromyxobacter sp.]|nr:hypothetical protein [Anaeromyxobacter sp.]
MERDRGRPDRRGVERELQERATEEERQRRGPTPTEDVMERALEIEPGVEQHAGEDPGVAADPERERTGPGPEHDPDQGEPE